MLRRLKREVLDQLPPKIRQKIEINTDLEKSLEIRRLLQKEANIDLDDDVAV